MTRLPDWQTLVEAPLLPLSDVPRQDGAKSPRRKSANRMLWQAVFHGDLAAVREALRLGASLTCRTFADVPLTASVRLGRWAIAHHLAALQQDLQHPHMVTLLWAILAERDCAEDVLEVSTWGMGLHQIEGDVLAKAHAPALLELWCVQRPQDVPPLLSFFFPTKGATSVRKPNVSALVAWLHTASMGTPTLCAALNEAWGVDAYAPHDLNQKLMAIGGADGADALRLLWDHMVHLDEAERAQACVAAGWSPPPTRPTKKGKTLSFSAALLKEGGPRISHWWFQAPGFLDEARRLVMDDPEVWRQLCRHDATAPRRLMDLELGIDWRHKDQDGRNVAHLMAERINLTLPALEDLLAEAPELFSDTDHGGRTPVDLLQDGIHQAQVTARLLAHRLRGLPEPLPQACMGRRRM